MKRADSVWRWGDSAKARPERAPKMEVDTAWLIHCPEHAPWRPCGAGLHTFTVIEHVAGTDMVGLMRTTEPVAVLSCAEIVIGAVVSTGHQTFASTALYQGEHSGTYRWIAELVEDADSYIEHNLMPGDRISARNALRRAQETYKRRCYIDAL